MEEMVVYTMRSAGAIEAKEGIAHATIFIWVGP